MTRWAVDFSTIFIPSITPADAVTLRAAGYSLAVIGFDSSDVSRQVRATLVNAGFGIQVYRFAYWSRPFGPQVADIITAIHQNPLPLPEVLWIDVEEEPGGLVAPDNPIAALTQIMDLVEAADVTATSQVRPGIYTRAGYWQAHFGDWSGPADRGWLLWTAEAVNDPDQATLYGGWQQAEGVQNIWNMDSPIGTVDASAFRDAVAPPVPTPPPNGDLGALTQRVTTLESEVAVLAVEMAAIHTGTG